MEFVIRSFVGVVLCGCLAVVGMFTVNYFVWGLDSLGCLDELRLVWFCGDCYVCLLICGVFMIVVAWFADLSAG